LCNQTGSLVAAEVERHGIPTVGIQYFREVAEKLRPPRALWVPFPLGYALGGPNDAPLQLSVLRQTFAVPAEQTTSCAFGGPALTRLYVTTATENWSDERRGTEPTAGLVYRLETDAAGRPAEPFRPDPGWWHEVAA
jgi:hypothetical protein